MAASQSNTSGVYDFSQLARHVDETLCCSICLDVPKEPQLCHNEHIFCCRCIKEHLRVNSPTCPQCQDVLTVDTLRPARIVSNLLSLVQVNINCDYASRGCPEITSFAGLAKHVENCGFAPVLCPNEHCGQEINRSERIHHEIKLCPYRSTACHEYQEMLEEFKVMMEALRRFSLQLKCQEEKITEDFAVFKTAMTEKFQEVEEKVETLKLLQDESEQKGEDKLNKIRKEIMESRRLLTENIHKVSGNVEEMKTMLTTKVFNMNTMKQTIDKLPSPTDGRIDTPRKDILIAGGCENRTSEIFSWKKGKWFLSSEMNEEHWQASSFVCNHQLFVIGGYSCQSIETMDLKQLPLQWKKIPGEFPYRSSFHQTVVYKQTVFQIGGCNWDTEQGYDVISELQLASSCDVKRLCRMPKPRSSHGAEIFDDKVLIFGGVGDDMKALRNVLVFDPKTNKCRERPPLRHGLHCMATVLWRDQVVLLGGQDDTGKVLNSVFKYDCKKGKITALPSMRKERSGCCAVITEDTIVVMGGMDNDYKALDSAECFTFGSSSAWKYLPQMNQSRTEAIAEVLPSAGIYITD